MTAVPTGPGWRRWRHGAIGAALLGVASLAGCSSGPPSVTVSVAGDTLDVPAAMYCQNGAPTVAGDTNGVRPLQVRAGQRVSIEVPDEVATAGWSVQVWSATEGNGTLLPAQLISVVPVGKQRAFDKITTSDAQPDRYYLIVAKAPQKGCTDAGGLWPVGFIRTG